MSNGALPLAGAADAEGIHEREQLVENGVVSRSLRSRAIQRLDGLPAHGSVGIRPDGRRLVRAADELVHQGRRSPCGRNAASNFTKGRRKRVADPMNEELFKGGANRLPAPASSLGRELCGSRAGERLIHLGEAHAELLRELSLSEAVLRVRGDLEKHHDVLRLQLHAW